MGKLKKFITILLSITLLSTYISGLSVVSAQGVGGWTFNFLNCNAEVTLDNEHAYSGKSSMKVINKTPAAPEVYVLGTYTVDVKAGKSYTVGAKVKSVRSTTVQLCIDWGRRYSLTPFGDTYNWTNFEFQYEAKETGTATFQIIIEGTTDGIWFDDMKFVDNESGKNLIKDFNFEGGASEITTEDTAASDDIIELYQKVSSSNSFTAEEMENVLGGFKYMPVYEQDGIVIDGKKDDWNSYVFAMPTLPTQYQVYIDDDRKKDASAVCMFAQDKENFYLIIEVTDDIFYYEPGGADHYWKGDSVQLAISGMDEAYGTEIGFAHNPETGKGEVYSSGLTAENINKINLKTSVDDNKIIYEAAIPWGIKFEAFQENILFDVLVNDNDGDGRRYCVELAPGISEGKTNAVFPRLEMLQKDRDWYAWVQGTRSAYTETEYTYETFLVNNGDKKRFTITYPDGKVDVVEVPKKSGIKKNIKVKFDNEGKQNVLVGYKCNEASYDAVAEVKVSRIPPSEDYHKAVIEKNKKNTAEIEKLLKKCEAKGISTDYETINFRVMERFNTYLEDDLKQKWFDNTYYTERALDKLYNEAKTSLIAYLNGEEKPVSVPKYITSEMRIDGDSVYAMTEVDGRVEERPVFFIGYGHFDQAIKDMPLFKELGANTIQTEIGPSYLLRSTLIAEDWDFVCNHDPEYTAEICNEETYEGDNSLKITYSSALKSNRYISFSQAVPVTPGKTYNFKGYIKTQNATNSWMSVYDYDNRIAIEGNSDWKEITATYTAPSNASTTTVRVSCDAICDAMYVDGFTFCEEGSNVNLLNNGGFNKASTKDFKIDVNVSAIQKLKGILEEAEKHNIAVSLLLSPHYFPTSIIEKYNISHAGHRGIFLGYNVHADIAKEIIEEYLRAIIPVIKDYKALNNICISNEPVFIPELCGDFYLDEWHNFLREAYGNDINMLNQAYGSTYASFEEIKIGWLNDAMEYDYKMFNDIIFSDWHRWMAEIIRELAPDIPLHSKIMHYVDDDDTAGRMKRGVGYEKYYDFFELNGCDAYDYIDDDSGLPQVDDGYLVEEMWYDYMRSIKDAPVINSEDHILPDRGANYADEVTDYVAQTMYMGAIHGRAISDIWVWERSYDSASDFDGSILFRPDTIAAIGRETLNLNRNAYEITALKNSDKEVGILYSDSSFILDNTTSVATYETYSACIYSGKAVRFVTPSQLHKMDYCKVLIVPQTTFVTSETLDYIKKYIENGGKVMIIGEESLKKNERGFENDKEKVDFIFDNSYVMHYDGTRKTTGSITKQEFHNEIRKFLSDANIYNVFIKDAENGEDTNYVEYNIGVYNGDVILNMVSYEQDLKVKIHLGDRVITSSYDINKNTELGEEIELKRYVPVTVRIKVDNCFIDTFGHWAENDIVKMAQKGIIKGVSESRFEPSKALTRAEFLSLLMRGISAEEGTILPADVESSSWYATDVSKAIKAGIIGETNFRPNDYITREEMCQMLVKGYEYAKDAIENNDLPTFTDNGEITDFDSVSKAYSLGLMMGRDDGSFGPNAGATRAEAAAVIARFSNLK